MNLTIQLRPCKSRQWPTAAIFLPGDSSAAWLDELVCWPVDQSAMRLVLVAAEQDQSLLGALVPLAESHADAVSAARPCGIAFGRVHPRLYIPVDAQLDPPCAAPEIEDLLPQDKSIHVWLPAHGLIRCDELAVRSLDQLVVAPALDQTDWGCAIAGEALHARLLSIQVERVPSPEEIMVDARGDIGSDAPGLSGLPISPGEATWPRLLFPWFLIAVGLIAIGVVLFYLLRSANWANLMALLGVVALVIGVIVLLGYLLSRFMEKQRADSATKRLVARAQGGRGKVGQAAGKGMFGMLGGVGAWISRGVARISKQLEALRHREIERLLHMLESRPDEGLRYALPLTATAAPRGFSIPGAKLLSRIVDFNLSRLGGGGPVDPWQIAPDYSARLSTRYRELANREIALGRHRRAAYIFAELLGDLRAAAATLADGGHYREAATLYDQRLSDPRMAAICLERGGLLTDAIPYYERIDEFEKVGELYERLGQTDSAQAAYRRAVDTKNAAGDLLSAARLLEQKLGQQDEAHDVLLCGWPASGQAESCLAESFHLLGRMAAHERAQLIVDRLTQDCESAHASSALAHCFAGMATKYPDQNVRDVAADRTRVLISQWLDRADQAKRTSLLESLRRLVPQDRLLSRDCQRYLQDHSEKIREHRSSSDKIRISGEFRLPPGQWRSAIAHRRAFYAAGYRGDEILLVRGLWDGRVQEATGKPWRFRAARDYELKLDMCEFPDARLFVHVQGNPTSEYDREFPATDYFGRRIAGGHSALTAETFFWCIHSMFMTCLQFGGGVSFFETRHLSDGRLVETWKLPVEEFGGNLSITTFTVYDGVYCLGTPKDGLVVIQRSSEIATATTIPLPRPLLRFARCAQRPTRLAACFDLGGMIWWGAPRHHQASPFGKDLCEPVAGFLRNGVLAAADMNCIEFYSTNDGDLRFIGRASVPQDRPTAVVALPNASTVALFTQAGHVRIYDVLAK